MDLNKLIGIPFKLGGEDFDGCDCVGICWLYHKFVHGKDYPHRDGGKIIHRDTSMDLQRISTVIDKFAHRVDNHDIQEGHIVILRHKEMGAMTVCISKHQILYMNERFGSALASAHGIDRNILRVYKINEEI